MISIDNKDVHSVALKLHKQFGHASSDKLIKLIRNSGTKNTKLESSLENVCKSCEVCLKFKRPVPRPIVALPLAEKFNDVVAMDLKSFGDNSYFLVLVDHATRYCASVVIHNKKPSTVVQSLFVMWISLFGPPSKFLFDNGGEFSNEEMRQLGETFNITMMTTAAESPWSNGMVERLNGVLAQSVHKIINDTGCDIKTALAWAVSARNTLDNFSGFSPCQLVFGSNTVLPNVLQSKPPALEAVSSSEVVRRNLNAMHSARQQFVKLESDEKLRRAMRHNIRESDAQTVQTGDHVYYKRKDYDEWKGPGVVIGRDGKQIIVKHAGQFIRVHVCRLTASSQIYAENNAAVKVNSLSENKVVSRNENKSSDNSITGKLYDSENDNNDASDSDEFITPDNSSDSSADEGVNDDLLPLNVNDVRVGQRIQGVDKNTGEMISGRIHSRAGKSTSKNTKFCYNILKNDNTVSWYDLKNDVQDLYIVPDHDELAVFFSDSDVVAAKDLEILNWKKNGVYSEVQDEGQSTISVRWVVTQKIKEGKPITKARLVARGFEEDSSELQKDAPTCLKESVKILISIASAKNWKLRSLDIQSAYLQGKPITREVYLKPPPEYYDGHIWKLNKTVYGLSDAARNWYNQVREQLLELGLKLSPYDSALFSYVKEGKLLGIICLYVDDFLFCGTEDFRKNVIPKIQHRFAVGSEEQGVLSI